MSDPTVRYVLGPVLRTRTRTYLPNWFEQTDAATFLGGGAIAGNESITITVTSGSAIVYGSITDNTTNDPAIQYASGAGDGSSRAGAPSGLTVEIRPSALPVLVPVTPTARTHGTIRLVGP